MICKLKSLLSPEARRTASHTSTSDIFLILVNIGSIIQCSMIYIHRDDVPKHRIDKKVLANEASLKLMHKSIEHQQKFFLIPWSKETASNAKCASQSE